jgi:Calcineurin-like phosphoesterase
MASVSDIDYETKDRQIFEKYCKKHKYYPLVLPSKKQIIAIGDLHGDYDLTIRVLKLAKLIDDNNKWIGKDTYVVQVGDQLDSCRPYEKKCDVPDSDNLSSFSETSAEDVRILELFTELDEQAQKDGGAVISLLGNHEIMNVMGNLNYVSYNDVQKFKDYKDPKNQSLKFDTPKDARIHAFKPGNEYAELMACTRVPAIIIGSFIFVHAGFINKFLEKLNMNGRPDLYKISYILRKWLLGIIDKNNVINIISSARYSLFWDRILGSIPPDMNNDYPQCVDYLNKALDVFQVDKMIIGHTPQFFTHNMGINKTCDDKLWRVDFGGSFGFHKFDKEFKKNGNSINLRNAQVLKIINDKEIVILKEKDNKCKLSDT